MSPEISPSVDSEGWFVTSSKRIDLLSSNDKLLLPQIQSHKEKKYPIALNFIIFNVALLLLALFLTCIIIRTLLIRTKQTAAIRHAMIQVVEHKDLSAIAKVMSHRQLDEIAENLNQLTAGFS